MLEQTDSSAHLCKSESFNQSMLEASFRGGGDGRACLTWGGICPPFFSQVSFGVGDPVARQYSLKVSPSGTSMFWGLTWTWGCVPGPLGLLDSGKVRLNIYIYPPFALGVTVDLLLTC